MSLLYLSLIHISYEEWTIYIKEGIRIDESFRKKMIEKEKQLENIIQKMIDEYNE